MSQTSSDTATTLSLIVSDSPIANILHTVDLFLSERSSPSHSLQLTDVRYETFLSVREHVYALALASIGFAKVARLSYDGSTKNHFISYPGLEHEVLSGFSELISKILQSKKKSFFGDVWSSDSTRGILSSKSAAVDLVVNGKKVSRQPDGSLCLTGNVFPFLVCEVADTQPMKPLFKKAYEYISGSKCAIRFVILIKLERTKPPRNKKRNRGSVGGSDSDRSRKVVIEGGNDESVQQDEGVTEDEPGKYSRGVFWVYTYVVGPSPNNPNRQSARVVCIEDEQEFYPNHTTSTLTLTWSSILRAGTVPEHVADKSVTIPYSLLGDLLKKSIQPKVPDFDSEQDLECLPDSSVEDSFESEHSEKSLPDNLVADPTYASRS